jgi:MFS family permease
MRTIWRFRFDRGLKDIQTGKIKICILSAAMMQMCFVGLVAAISDISRAFPDTGIQVIQTCVNTINLTGIGGALLAGWLSGRQTKKQLILIGLGLIVIGGVGGFFCYHSLRWIFVWSFIIGGGIGLFTPLVTSLIIDCFDGDERNRLAGLQTTFINTGGVIVTFFGGVLAAVSWHCSYLIFLAAIPVFFICIVGLPARDKVKTQGKTQKKLSPRIMFYMVVVLLFMLSYSVFASNISLYFSENQLGAAPVAGAANAVFMLSGAVCGVAFNRLSRQFGDYLFGIAHLLLCCCYLILFLCNSSTATFAAAAIGGCAISLTLPQCIRSVSSFVDPELSTKAMSLVISVSSSVGVFFSPVFIAFLGATISSGNDSKHRFLTACAVGLSFAVGLLLASWTRTRNTRHGIKERKR